MLYDRRLGRLFCLGALALVAAAGCSAGFKTTTGGATAPVGVAGGTSRSVVFTDEGGLLTRTGLLGLATLTAAGAVQTSTREVGRRPGPTPGTVTVTTETTTTVNPSGLEDAVEVANAATDPSASFSSASGGLGASLEIAHRSLGGDTSGFQFGLGWNFRRFQIDGALLRGVRGSAGFGFGRFTLNDRMRRTYEGLDDIDEMMGDWRYTFIGAPVRAGYVVGKVGGARDVRLQAAVEVFAGTDLNLVTGFDVLLGEKNLAPSPWHTGARLELSLLYVEAIMSMSSLAEYGRSFGLEVGLAY